MIAFVLGGGGMLGAVEVGMLQALVAGGVRPELVLGSSVGAINGAAAAADFSEAAMARLAGLWESLGRDDIFSGGLAGRVSTAVRSRTHLHDNAGLRRLVAVQVGDLAVEELAVPFQCVAACIETARPHWFDAGPVADAVLASSAVPGLLPAVHLGGLHYLDGGLVDSVPVGRAVELGATTVYVLQVGRVEQPLRNPRWPWEVAAVAFEIARRHRYAEAMAALPTGLTVHLLPSGATRTPTAALRYRDTSQVRARISAAREATAAYLADVGTGLS